MENKWLVLGPVAMAVLCLMVFLAIAFSPWFMWQSNALSDLGNPYNGAIAAAVFNLGLGASGFMLLAYSLKSLKFQARKASLMLAVTGFFLFMVGALNES
ncbi:MAG TPA: hypothetical protein VJ485_01795, partial [archaeon]|nr:hypothetical protein [archaeon]